LPVAIGSGFGTDQLNGNAKGKDSTVGLVELNGRAEKYR